MNRWREALSRYEGEVPIPFAVYRAPIVGMAGVLPATFGICSFRSLAEINVDRDKARTQAHDLMAEAETLAAHAKGRAFTAGEGERVARLTAGQKNAETRLDELNAEYRAGLTDMAADPDGRYAEGPFVPAGESRATAPVSQLRSQAERTIDGLHRAGSLPDHAAEKATGLLMAGGPYEQDLAARWVKAAGDPAYLTAFQKLIGDPERGHLLFDPKELDAYRAVQGLRAAGLTIAGTGQYMIPLTLDPAVILSSAGTTNAMRKVSRIVQTATNTWQGVTSAGVTAEWVATEATQVAEATPTLAPVSIPVILGDAYLHASFQTIMDAPNFQSEMSKILLDAADSLMATAYTTGAGTTEPKGIVTALVGGASEINGTGSEAIIAADPFSLQNALPARFSSNAKFMAHLAIINALAQLETTNGALRFPEIANGRLLNRELVENSDMDGAINPAATANNYVLLYGDFAEFIIADRIGSTLEVVQNVVGANHRPTAERGFLLWFRTGSDVSTIAAFRLLDVPTTA